MRRTLVLLLLLVAAVAAAIVVFSPDGASGTAARGPLRRDVRPAAVEGHAAYAIDSEDSLSKRLSAPIDREAKAAAVVYSPLPPAAEGNASKSPGLRVIGGGAGERGAFDVLDGLAGAIEALAAAPGMDAELARALRATLDRLERVAQGEAEHPMRAMFLRGSVDSATTRRTGSGVVLSDRSDPLLDAGKPRFTTGTRLLVNRIEGSVEDGAKENAIVGGVVEVAGDGAGGSGQIPPMASKLASPSGDRFRGDPAPAMGIGLGPDGSVVVYGVGPGHRVLPASPALTAAVLAVLRRV